MIRLSLNHERYNFSGYCLSSHDTNITYYGNIIQGSRIHFYVVTWLVMRERSIGNTRGILIK